MEIYLDNSATTRPTGSVIRALTRALESDYYNPSSLYAPALGVEKQLDACRDRIRAVLHLSDAAVIFTSGGTEANNLALTGTLGVSRAPLRVAVSAGEHPSVYDAALSLMQGGACECAVLPLNAGGTVDIDAVRSELKKGLTLLSVMQVNNETGAKNDIAEISRLAREICPACRLHVDGVQGFMREDFDLRLADMYTLSGHKIHAPKGVGALVVRRGLRLKSAHVGGGQENALRSGTENTPGILALSQAIDDMRALPLRREHMLKLKLLLARELAARIPEATVNGPAPEDGACNILNVSLPPVRGETILHALEAQGVLVSTGSACSAKKQKLSRVLTSMGVPARRAECALRFSLSPYNTEEEILRAAQIIQEQYAVLSKFQRR